MSALVDDVFLCFSSNLQSKKVARHPCIRSSYLAPKAVNFHMKLNDGL